MDTSTFNFIRFDKLNSEQADSILNNCTELDTSPNYLQADAIKIKYWKAIFSHFPSYQFIIAERDTVIAAINCVPLSLVKNELDKLPDEGWRWALEKAFSDQKSNLTPNTLCVMSISINKLYHEDKMFPYIMQQLKQAARLVQYKTIICPIRPKMKQHYPLQDITNYAQWITNTGLPYDIEIKKHVLNSAVIQRVCTKSIYIEGTITQWEDWTGYTFQTTGEYVLPMGLTTLRVNVELNKGYYTEPNIWMVYRL